MSEAVALVLVDFDDTLVDTAPRFHGARERLFERMVQALGAPRDLIRRVHHEHVDPRMLQAHGLGPARLPHSFRETYLHLCEHTGIAADDAVLAECEALADAVRGTPPLLAGAIDALHRLARRHRAVIYTQAGEPEYQLACVRESGALDAVGAEGVHICARKTTDAFRATLRRFGIEDPATAWMVGNSIRADVNPALEAGGRAIHIEIEGGWEGDVAEPVSDAYLRVRSFAEAVDLLLELPALQPH